MSGHIIGPMFVGSPTFCMNDAGIPSFAKAKFCFEIHPEINLNIDVPSHWIEVDVPYGTARPRIDCTSRKLTNLVVERLSR